MPMELSRVAMITSQAPSSTTFPAKQYPELTPTIGTSPDSFPSSRQVRVDRPPTEVAAPSGIAGPEPPPARPPPPSEYRTTGSLYCWAIRSMRSVFWWFLRPWVPASTE